MTTGASSPAVAWPRRVRRDGMVIVYDTVTRDELGRMTGSGHFVSVDVSDDGRYVLAAHVLRGPADRQRGGHFRLLPVSPAEAKVRTTSMQVEHDGLGGFRPGGDQFIVVTSDGVIALWGRATASELEAIFPAPAGLVEFRLPAAEGLVGFGPDGILHVVQHVEDPENERDGR